ncbi:L,D-transpeptidase family protein [Roseomonas hellenica]|uniref:L,D-transpeptidase family protein n=1 Tax=Plastoroseomonas hellenica TaxID=2687306 RepID=A0ABS5EZS5_9PROT|nr:L,D-transpeptidase family protein [Plastoroseomonas hellenica]MBR0665807.1 L,D-transpeptidase family protein [Plastoroseomonas hellenica]
MRALRWKVGLDREEQLSFAQVPVSRRTTLAAACALSACSAYPEREAVPVQALPADTELRDLSDDAPELVVAGERLNAGLLRRFYARHGFEPVWTTRQTQADSLVDAVLRAGDHGLDPERFHASLLLRRATFPPLRRELLLSDAFLSYASALAFGAVPVERRKDGEALTPEPTDVAAALDTAIGSPDPAAAIEALAPTTPTYQALRQALRRYRPGAPAGGSATASRLRQIEVNLERQRWLPRPLPADRAWVNVADQRLVLYRADQPIFSTRVVVGDDAQRNQSPEFRAMIEASFFNPPWVIPSDIVTAEILPIISRDPHYLTRNNMVMRDNGEVEQQPGPNAGLGLIMFDMPNRFDVYLHDTPDKHLFSRDNRRISHGCIRVQNPLEFAALLMQQPIDAIHQGIAIGGTIRNSLPTPVPVFVVYQTAFADADGRLEFRPDFYNRDADIWRHLQQRG